MSEPTPDLANLTLEELRQRWRAAVSAPVPAHSSRDLLRRALTYRLEVSSGNASIRKLHQRLRKIADEIAADPDFTPPQAPQFQAGAVLIRDWGGKRYVVTASDAGFLLDGQVYKSLSAVAFAITGVKWSGPRFFDLAKSSESTGP